MNTKLSQSQHELPLVFAPATTASELCNAFDLVALDVGLSNVPNDASITLNARLGGSGPSFAFDGSTLSVIGATVPQVLRAITAWRGNDRLHGSPSSSSHQTVSAFQTLGLMLDASRNGVATVSTVKQILRAMALLGMNALMLYTEDTFEVPGQPYIGYLRGRYSQAELGELDDYSHALGIEMFPCIQTLAHLGQMLRWPVFKPVSDTSDILLAEEEKTYALLEQMIDAASAPYRSRRIHIGMDEAHDIGLGEYRRRHGMRPRFDILSDHLRRVNKACQRRGLRPMMWSDMYFRLAASNGHYYAPDAKVPPEIVPDIPRDVQMVYWDYYHTDPAVYADFIERHRVMPNDCVLCLGLWSWNRFWLCESLTRAATTAGMTAAKAAGVSEVFTAAWGDDGMEVDLLSILPGLVLTAAYGYDEPVDEKVLRRDFAGACRARWQDWSDCAAIDETPGRPTLAEAGFDGDTPGTAHLRNDSSVNWDGSTPSKALLWQDPLLGLLDGQGIALSEIAEHYRVLSERLTISVPEKWVSRRRLPLALSRVLELKSDLGQRMLSAYVSADRDAIQNICEQTLPELVQRCTHLQEVHEEMWHALYKPFGWETIDRRYGGLIARLNHTRKRLRHWLDGHIERIEELEEKRLPVFKWPRGKLCETPHHGRLISPSIIS